MKLNLRTYGCGNRFDNTKFKPVRNKNWIKPFGGLWSSPINSKHGWKDWCTAESFGDLTHWFDFKFEGKVFVIDGIEDAKKMPWITICEGLKFPDFETLSKEYDAIWLTWNGQVDTRWNEPNLYGWDCESVLVMNSKGIKI